MAVEWKRILTTDDLHSAVTVSAPISLSGQALSLVNDAAATITEIDTGALANSDTVIPTSKAVTTAIAGSSGTDNVARDNIVVLAWKLAIAEGLSVFNLEDGVIDEFEDETGIDTGNSANESYNSTDDYYSPSSGAIVDLMEYASDATAQAAYVTNGAGGVTVYSKTLSEQGTAWGTNHLRQILSAANITNASMTKVRVQYKGDSGGSYVVDLSYLGRRDGSTYNMLTTGQTKVKLTFSGNDSVTVPAGGTVYSDWVDFATDGTEDLLVSVDLNDTFAYIAKISSGGDTNKFWSSTDGAASNAAPGGGTEQAGYQNLVSGLQYETNYLQSYSESTIKSQGSYSLKGVATTDALNKTLTRTISSPIDLSGVDSVFLDMYALRTGSNIKIGLHDSGGTTTEITPNITDSNTWQEVEIDLSGVADANKDAIDSIIVTIVNADADNTFYIDNFSGPLESMTLISESAEAEIEPTTGRFLALVEPVDSITINTDIKGYISNDDGSNFDEVTLTDEGYFDSTKKILSGNVALTDRSDKTMVQKIQTFNNKDLKVHAWGMLWK